MDLANAAMAPLNECVVLMNVLPSLIWGSCCESVCNDGLVLTMPVRVDHLALLPNPD